MDTKKPIEDTLKDFVTTHKEEMDLHSPPTMNWKNVNLQKEQGSISSHRMVRLSSVLKIAAAILCIVVGSFVWFVTSTNNQYPLLTTVSNQDIFKADLLYVSDEIAEIDAYYISQLNTKLLQLKKEGIDKEALEQIQVLDQEFKSLRDEFGPNINNQLILYEMVDNYRIKLALLENIVANSRSDEHFAINEENKKYNDEKYTVYN